MELTFFVNGSDDVADDKHLCNDSSNMTGMRVVTSISTYFLCVFAGSLSICIICGNLFLIISIVYFRQLHTPTNYLILSLAVADLLLGVIVLPFSVLLSISKCWHFTGLLCKIRGNFDVFLCSTSILNLCFISVERYFAVCHPLTYRAKINVHVIVIMILVSWTFPAFNGISVTVVGVKQRQLSGMCVLFQKSSPILVVLGIGLGFYLPAIIMSSIYLKILMVAHRQAHSIQSTTYQITKSESKMEMKATKTLAIVMGTFLLCWTPFFLCMTFNPLTNYTISVPMIATFKCLGWSNSMLNPLVYAFFYSWFRSAFRMIVSGKIFQGNFTNALLN